MRGDSRLAILGLLLAASTSASPVSDASPTNSPSRRPPWEISMDRPFGPEGRIVVKLHLGDGQELPLMVDTGAPCTVLDQSLEPKLGPRIGTAKAAFSFNQNIRTWQVYHAPRLFANGRRLLTGPEVFTVPFPASRHPDKGILGTDCLQHYCLQPDFAAGKIFFLDPDNLDTANLGKALPLDARTRGIACFEADLFGQGKMRFILDTGMGGPFDAMLAPKLFNRLLRTEPTAGPDLYMTVPDGRVSSGNIFPRLSIVGQSYADVWLSMVDPRPRSIKGLIGLGFLARHKVTLNFPHRTLYLKWLTSGPVADKSKELGNKHN
jgi:hypothetical protein